MDLKEAKMEVKEIKTKEMTKLQRFSEVKSGKINFSEGLCNCDWLEFSISGELDGDLIEVLKIRQSVTEKKSQTYKHIIEFEDYTIMYGFYGKSSNSQRVHVRISNERLYDCLGLTSPFSYYTNLVKPLFKFVDIEHSYISRIDLAFDVVEKSFNYDKILFCIKNNTWQNPINGERKQICKFRENWEGLKFKNYSVGSRSSDVYIRFYNKTIENFDRNTGCVKKQYISNLHNCIDSVNNWYRLEFEIKYENMPITLQTFESATRCLINEHIRECDYSEALTLKTRPVKVDCLTDKFCYELLGKLTKYLNKYPVAENLSVSTLMKCLKSKVLGKVNKI